jgi:hypothetical protein
MSISPDDRLSVPLNWEEYPSGLPCQANGVDQEHMTQTKEWLSQTSRSISVSEDLTPTKVHVAWFRSASCPGDRLEKLFFSDANELAAFIENDVRI